MRSVSIEWHSKYEHQYIHLDGKLEVDIGMLLDTESFVRLSVSRVRLGAQILYFRDGVWYPGYIAKINKGSKTIVIQRCYGKRVDTLTKTHLANVNKTVRCPTSRVMVLREEFQGVIAYAYQFRCRAEETEEGSTEEEGSTGEGVTQGGEGATGEGVTEEEEVTEEGEVTEEEDAKMRMLNARFEELASKRRDRASEAVETVEVVWKDSGYLLYVIREMLRMGLRMRSETEFKVWLDRTYLQPSKMPGVAAAFRLPPFADCDEMIAFVKSYLDDHPEEFVDAWRDVHNSTEDGGGVDQRG